MNENSENRENVPSLGGAHVHSIEFLSSFLTHTDLSVELERSRSLRLRKSSSKSRNRFSASYRPPSRLNGIGPSFSVQSRLWGPTSRSFRVGISLNYKLIDSSWTAISKVLWVRNDPLKRWAANEPKMCYFGLRWFLSSWTISQIKSQHFTGWSWTQKMFDRVFQELSNGVKNIKILSERSKLLSPEAMDVDKIEIIWICTLQSNASVYRFASKRQRCSTENRQSSNGLQLPQRLRWPMEMIEQSRKELSCWFIESVHTSSKSVSGLAAEWMKKISHTTRAFFQYPLRRCRIGIRSRIITSHHRVQLLPHFFASFFHFLTDFQPQQAGIRTIAAVCVQ